MAMQNVGSAGFESHLSFLFFFSLEIFFYCRCSIEVPVDTAKILTPIEDQPPILYSEVSVLTVD